jgi:hypothetical protein
MSVVVRMLPESGMCLPRSRTETRLLHRNVNVCFSFTKKCDDNATCMYLLSAASCWLAMRVHMIAGEWSTVETQQSRHQVMLQMLT